MANIVSSSILKKTDMKTNSEIHRLMY